MSEGLTNRFLPTTIEEMKQRGWDCPDFIYVSGDAYVDHPSFGHAVISRVLEKHGFKVAILPQPKWQSLDDIKKLGKPRLGFLVTSGVIDSMVNHYTADIKPRRSDLYSPGGKAGCRPNRAVIVYCNLIRQAFGDIPIIVGGVEASLRRFAHYDYWENNVRSSLLKDCGADLLIYGMGERAIVEVAEFLDKGISISRLKNLRGTSYMASKNDLPNEIRDLIDSDEKKITFDKPHRHFNKGIAVIPSYEAVKSDKKQYCEAFMVQNSEQDSINGNTLVQQHGGMFVVQNPPAKELSPEEMDEVYELPYVRAWHPMYDAEGGIPAFDEVKFSIADHRGCFGSCNFCALNYHQGRVVQKRTKESVINEAKMLTHEPDFKGYIHDIGGPSANFRERACDKQIKSGVCKNRQCLFPEPCPNLKVDYSEYLDILKKVRNLPKVKKVFVRSGLRYDHMLLDETDELLTEICKHHISGQLKVAPEHISDKVLYYMGKPSADIFDEFREKYFAINRKIGKDQYLVPYLMSSHPGSDMRTAVNLALYLKRNHINPEQVQNFYPTPGTMSTCMYYTGYDPRTMKKVYVPRSKKEREMQRKLLQFYLPENYDDIRKVLLELERKDLIGYGEHCLVPPKKVEPKKNSKSRNRYSRNKNVKKNNKNNKNKRR